MSQGTVDFTQFMSSGDSFQGTDLTAGLQNSINSGSLSQEFSSVAKAVATESTSLNEQLNSAYQKSVYGGTEDSAPTGMTPELSEHLRTTYGNVGSPDQLFKAMVDNRDFNSITALYGSQVANQLADSVGYGTDSERKFTHDINAAKDSDIVDDAYDAVVTVGGVVASIPEIVPAVADLVGKGVATAVEGTADFVQWIPHATGMDEESIKSFAETADAMRDDARRSQVEFSKLLGSNSELGKLTHDLSKGAQSFHTDAFKAATDIEQRFFKVEQKAIDQKVKDMVANGDSEIYANAVGIAEEFSSKIGSLIDNPTVGVNNAIGVIGDIVTGGAIGKNAVKLAVKNSPEILAKKLGYMPSEKELANWLKSDEAKTYFAKVAERSALIYTMAREGASNGSEMYQKIEAMTHEDLMNNSPKYKTYVEEYGMSKEDAKQLLATDAVGQVFLTQGVAAGLASKFSGMAHYSGNLFNKTIPNKVVTSTAGSALENTSQGLTGQLAQNLAAKDTVNANQSLTENVGKGAAEGFVGGLGGGVVTNAPKVAAVTILAERKAAKNQAEFDANMDKAATEIDDIIDGKTEVKTTPVDNTITPDTVSDTAAENSSQVSERASRVQEVVPDISTERATEIAEEIANVDTIHVPKESMEPIVNRDNFVPVEQALSPDNTLLEEIKGDAKSDNVIAEKGVGHLLRKALDIYSRGDESVSARDAAELSTYVYQIAASIEDGINNNYAELAQLGTSEADTARKAVLVDAIRKGEAVLYHDSELVGTVISAATTILQNAPNVQALMQEYATKAESLASAPIEQVRPVLFQLANSPESLGSNATVLAGYLAQNPNLSPVERVVVEAIQATAPTEDSTNVRDNIFKNSRDGFKSISDHYAGVVRSISAGNAPVLKTNMEGLKRFADHMSTKAATFQSAINTARTTGETVNPVNPITNRPYLQKDGVTHVNIHAGSQNLVEAVNADAAKVREATNVVRGIANSAVKAGIFTKQQIPSQTVAKPVNTPNSKLVQDIQTEATVTDTAPENVVVDDIAAKVTREPSKPAEPVKSTAANLHDSVVRETTYLSKAMAKASEATQKASQQNALYKYYRPSKSAELTAFQKDQNVLIQLTDPNTTKSDMEKLLGTSMSNEAFTKLQGVFTKHVNTFMSTFDAKYKESLKDFSVDKLPWNRHNSLYFVVDNGNGELGISPQLTMGMATELTRFVGEELPSMTSNLSDIESVMTDDSLTFDQREAMLEDMQGYSDFGAVATRLGQNILTNIGLTPNKQTPSNVVTKIATDIGIDALHLLSELGYVDYKTIQHEVLAEDGTTYFVNNNIVTAKDGLFKAEGVKQGAQDIVDTVGLLAGSIYPVNNSRTISVGKPFRKSEALTTYRNSNVVLPDVLRNYINDMHNKPWTVVKPLYNLRNNMSESAWKAVARYQEATPTVFAADRINGLNSSIEQSMTKFNDGIEQMIATGGDWINKPIYINMRVVNNARSMLVSNTINPQSQKEHRQLVSRAPAKVDYNNSQDVMVFQLTLAQALGVSVDKSDTSKSLQELASVLHEPVVNEAIGILMLHNRYPEPLTPEQESIIVQAVNKGGEKYKSLDALNEYARYLNAKEDGIDFHTQLAYELDGLTHGPFTAYLQLGLDSINAETINRLQRGGIFVDNNNITYPQFKSSDPTFRDTYEAVADEMNKRMGELLTGSLNKDSGAFVTLESLQKYYPRSKAKLTFDSIMVDGAEYATNIKYTSDRNLSKKAATSLGAYSAGKGAVVNQLANDLLAGFRDKYDAAYQDMIGTIAQSVKDGNENNPAITEKFNVVRDIMQDISKFTGERVPTELTPAVITYLETRYNPSKALLESIKMHLDEYYVPTLVDAVTATTGSLRANTKKLITMGAMVNSVFNYVYHETYKATMDKLRETGKLSSMELLPEAVERDVFNRVAKVYAPVYTLNGYGKKTNEEVSGIAAFEIQRLPVEEFMPKADGVGVASRGYGFLKAGDQSVNSSVINARTVGKTGVLHATNLIQSLEAVLQARLGNDMPNLQHQNNFDGVDVNQAHVQSTSDNVNRLFTDIQANTTVMEMVNTQLHNVLDQVGAKGMAAILNKIISGKGLLPATSKLASDIEHVKSEIYSTLYDNAFEIKNKPLTEQDITKYLAIADQTTNKIKAIKDTLFNMGNTTVDQFPSNLSRFVNNRSANVTEGNALQRWADSARSQYATAREAIKADVPLVQSLATPQVIAQESSDAYTPVSHDVETATKVESPYADTRTTFNRADAIARLERVFVKNKDAVGQHVLNSISKLLPESLEVYVGTAEQMNQLAHELYPAQMNGVNVDAKGMTIGDTVFISSNTSETHLHELAHAALWNTFNNYYTDPATVPVAARKSVAQLEKIGERFLTDTRIADNQSVNTLRQVMEKAKAEGDKFTFTQEFVVWTLSNKDIQATAGETSLKGRISKLTKAAFKAIRQLFGMKDTPKVNSYLTNVLAHTDNITQSVRSDITNLSPSNEAVLMQQQYDNFSKVSYSDIFAMSRDTSTPEHSAKMGRQWGNIYEAVTPLLAQRAQEKGINSFDDTIFMNELNTPELLNTTKLMAANGFTLSDKQQLLFSALHTVIGDALNSNKELATVNLDRVYQDAKAQLTPEQLITKGEPVSLGKARYDALFTNATTTSDAVTGKSDRLVNFLSLYAVSPQFANAMQGIQVKADKSQGDIVSRTFETVTDKALSLLGNKTLSTHSQVRLDNLLEKLSVIDAEARNTLMNRALETGNTVNRAITRMEDRISAAGSVMSEKGMQRAIEAGKNYSSDQSTLDKLKAGAVIGEGLAETMLVGNNENNLRDSVDAVTTMMNEFPSKPSDRIGTIAGIVNEFIGITHQNRSYAKLLDVAKFVREFARQNILEVTPRNIKAEFTQPLTDQQSTDIKHGWLDTDTSSLIEKGYTLNEIHDLYSNDARLTAEIGNKEAELLSYGQPSTTNNFILNQSEGLGWMMVHNTSGLENQAPSAQAIIDTAQAFNGKSIDASLVQVVDDLASLWAIKHLDKDTRSSISDLITSEGAALQKVSNLVNQTRSEEASKALKGADKLALKGSTAAIDNPNKSLVIAPLSKKSEMANNGYVMGNAIEKASYDTNTEPMHYFYADNVAKPSWISGIMSTVRQTLGGVNVAAGKTVNGLRIEAYSEPDVVNSIAANGSTGFNNQFNGRVKPDAKVNHPIPVFDLHGKIVGYEYTVGKAERKARLDSDTDFANVLGTWRGRVFEEMVGKEINRELVNLMHNDYVEDVNKFHIRSHVVIDPKSKDPYIQEIYRMIPPEMKEHIRDVFPDGKLRVRRNVLDNALGMREWSVNEVLNKSPAERNGFEAALAYTTKAIFGEKAAYRAGQGTRWLKAYAKLAKNTVIVKNVVVQAVNMISNILQGRARGTSFTDIVKDYTAAMKYADDYRKLAKEQVTLQNQLIFNQGNAAKTASINNRLAEVMDLMARNPANELIQAGLLPTISTEETPNDKYELGYNFIQKLNSYIDKMPKGLSTAAKEAMLLRDSRAYKLLDKVNQYSDFMSKYSLYKQLTERQEVPESHERAMNIIQDEFVNYNFIPTRGRQFLDSTGFTWFLNYRIRSQKIIARLARKHPLRMGGQIAYTTLGASTILDTNIITGNWASAFGLTNGFRMIASHPLIALMSDTVDGAANIIRGK